MAYELLPRVVRALALTYDGRVDEATEVAGRLRADAERLGNPSMLAAASYALGEALMNREPTAAAALFERAGALARTVRNRLLSGVAAVSAASLLARTGEPAAALRSFATVIDDLHGANDWTHLWTGLRSLVELLTRIGANRDAAFLYAAVTHRPTAPPVYGEDSERLRTVAATLTHRLGPAALDDARTQAAVLTDQDVIAWARAVLDRAAAP